VFKISITFPVYPTYPFLFKKEGWLRRVLCGADGVVTLLKIVAKVTTRLRPKTRAQPPLLFEQEEIGWIDRNLIDILNSGVTASAAANDRVV